MLHGTMSPYVVKSLWPFYTGLCPQRFPRGFGTRTSRPRRKHTRQSRIYIYIHTHIYIYIYIYIKIYTYICIYIYMIPEHLAGVVGIHVKVEGRRVQGQQDRDVNQPAQPPLFGVWGLGSGVRGWGSGVWGLGSTRTATPSLENKTVSECQRMSASISKCQQMSVNVSQCQLISSNVSDSQLATATTRTLRAATLSHTK
jgi:hypothetical protein